MTKRKKKRPIEKLSGQNAAMIRMLVGNLHVSTSNLDVCRRVIGPWIHRANAKYRRSKKTGRVSRGWQSQVSPALRRGAVAACIEAHQQNIKLYNDVMRGRVG